MPWLGWSPFETSSPSAVVVWRSERELSILHLAQTEGGSVSKTLWRRDGHVMPNGRIEMEREDVEVTTYPNGAGDILSVESTDSGGYLVLVGDPGGAT